ncbi:Origin recognition complex, subunit 1 [Coemansia brasiliensis]|uniref:Origin recognition complex subunit 1 n=1 Tax=Coemansia brasiliensis TaxID=2650707 RepID=A0A9W8M128_9FUNG|nr:Origin recognition complex, subunit 1 [Coemansia brasiliensis]
MTLALQRQKKIANQLVKATRAQQTKRKRHQDTEEPDAVVEWGEQVAATPATPATPSTRRVTRRSGMTNKVLYKSVWVNGLEYTLGQAVRVKSAATDDPYFAIIFKLWENEQGVKQLVARWLLRTNEMFLKTPVAAAPQEIFYSNADDLITPDMILGPLKVVSSEQFAREPQGDDLRMCCRCFEEHSGKITEIDWEQLYTKQQLLDPQKDEALFSREDKKDTKTKASKPAAKRIRGSAIKTDKSNVRAKRAPPDEMSDEEASTEDEDFKASGDDNDDDGIEVAVTSTVRAKRKRSIATATPRRSRGKRLQDIATPTAVTAAMLKRASRVKKPEAADESNMTIYEAARHRLHVSAVPDALPCREDEFAEIYGHLSMALSERNSMCMYISGVPGTGKTATVLEVIRTLQQSVQDDEIPDFQFIELNGMKMTEPAQAYTQLWQAIANEKATPKHAAQLLEKHFSTPSPRRHSYVVLVDELDLLVTKSQSIMYNFFDWPHRPHAKLIVVAIANTMDLPERMLHHKVSSRLGLTRINFQPYSHQQLMAIVQSRLEGCTAFDADAIELCARKISAVSGDARRALDVCRRAVEMVEQDQLHVSKPAKQPLLVTMMVIDRAVKEMYASGHISFIQHASVQQKVFLVALRAAIRKAGVPQVSLGDVVFIHRQLCQMHQLRVPSHDQCAKLCAQLSASRCVLAESSILDVHQQVRLAVAEEDITVALRPDPVFQKIASS